MATPLGALKQIGQMVLPVLSGDPDGWVRKPYVEEDSLARWYPPEAMDDATQAWVGILTMVRASPVEVRRAAAQVAELLGTGHPPEVVAALWRYLASLPSLVRSCLVRPDDPAGTTIPSGQGQHPARVLFPFLPVRVPNFQPGDRPLGMGDWELVELLSMDPLGETWRARHPSRQHVPTVLLRFATIAADPRQAILRELDRYEHLHAHSDAPVLTIRQTALEAGPPAIQYEDNTVGSLVGLLASVMLKSGQGEQGPATQQTLALVHRLAQGLGWLHEMTPPALHGGLRPTSIRLSRPGVGGPALPSRGSPVLGGHWQPHFLDLGGTNPLLHSNKESGTPSASPGNGPAGGPDAIQAPPDLREDVRALGQLWYRLLTGRQELASVYTGWDQELLEVGVSKQEVDILASCLADDPQGRPANAGVLVQQLEELMPDLKTMLTSAGVHPASSPAGMPLALAAPVSGRDAPGDQGKGSGLDDLLSPRQPPERSREKPGTRSERELTRGAPRGGEPSPVYQGTSSSGQDPSRDARNEPARSPVQEGAPPTTRVGRTGRGQKVWDLLDTLGEKEPELSKLLVNSVEMKFVLVPAGTFRMGSPSAEAGRRDNESPVHEVVLTDPIYLTTTPVTQEQYQRVMGKNPSRFNKAGGGSPQHPVDSVSWDDAQEFLRTLMALEAERSQNRIYRLPTEAEWEYACRAGTSSPFHFGASLSSQQANFDGNYPYAGERGIALHRTSRVGSYPANNFGLHDMHGNVWEWCADFYDVGYYRQTPRQNPPGPTQGQYRVLRGGSWRNQASTCRAAYRNALQPNQRQPIIGFRVVLQIKS